MNKWMILKYIVIAAIVLILCLTMPKTNWSERTEIIVECLVGALTAILLAGFGNIFKRLAKIDIGISEIAYILLRQKKILEDIKEIDKTHEYKDGK